jgi:DNA-binding XRE family transcriptional regulator
MRCFDHLSGGVTLTSREQGVLGRGRPVMRGKLWEAWMIWWTPLRIRALRMARGETQAKFADAMGVSPNTVQRWEAGVMPPTQGVILQRLDQLLEELTPVQRQRFDDWVGEPAPASSHCAVSTPSGNGGDMNRRDALEALFVAMTEGTVLALPPLPAQSDEPVDAALVADYEQGLALLASGYLKGNPRVMLPSAVGFAEGLAPVLRNVPTHELGLRLADVAVDAHALAGILASNAGDPAATLHHVALACYYAEFSGDPLLRARAYTTRARCLYSALRGNPQGSVRWAVAEVGRAKALARHADGHTRAWVGATFVEEAADLGDVDLCKATLERARKALDTATGHAGGLFSPAGMFGNVEVFLDGVSGRVAGLAGRLDEAERILADQISRAQSAVERVNGLCRLGTVRIEGDEPEGASAALVSAATAAHVSCAGRLVRVRAVRHRMPPEWDALDCVVDLDEQLRALA